MKPKELTNNPIYTANQVADWFINSIRQDSGDTISHLKLQKLVYYAQAWNYTLFNNVIFKEEIQAWKHGPVVRSIYDRFKSSNVYTPINVSSLEIELVKFDERTEDLLLEINEIYGEHSASYLEDLTHSEKPWILARKGLPDYVNCENEITLKSMKDFYSQKLVVDGQQS